MFTWRFPVLCCLSVVHRCPLLLRFVTGLFVICGFVVYGLGSVDLHVVFGVLLVFDCMFAC